MLFWKTHRPDIVKELNKHGAPEHYSMIEQQSAVHLIKFLTEISHKGDYHKNSMQWNEGGMIRIQIIVKTPTLSKAYDKKCTVPLVSGLICIMPDIIKDKDECESKEKRPLFLHAGIVHIIR